jgi:hypothetical protein
VVSHLLGFFEPGANDFASFPHLPLAAELGADVALMKVNAAPLGSAKLGRIGRARRYRLRKGGRPMQRLSPTKTALAVGVFLGVWHVIWSLLVALNWAQAIYDFILWAHMIHLQLTIGPFDLAAAIMLVVVTFLVGCAFGYIFALIWNWLHRAATT